MLELEGGMVGFVTRIEKDEEGNEKSVVEAGVIVVLRKDGDEALFASRESTPLRWIKTEEFTADPASIMSFEEASREEDEDYP